MIYAVEKRYATKLIGVRCRIVTGLFVEPTLEVGDTGYFMRSDRSATFTLFGPEGDVLARGDFFDMCREAKRLLRERDGQAPAPA